MREATGGAEEPQLSKLLVFGLLFPHCPPASDKVPINADNAEITAQRLIVLTVISALSASIRQSPD
jgi:hypothetical protein